MCEIFSSKMTDITLLQRLTWIVNVIFHQAVAVIVVYILTVVFKNYDIDAYGTWHVVLSTLGLVLLAAEAIALFAPENVYTLEIKRPTKIKIHAVMMFLGVFLITTGISLKISEKDKFGWPHFESTHAILGLIAWILMLLSICFGILSGNSQELKQFARPVIFKLVHNMVGILGFILGIMALGYGLYEASFKIFSSESTVEAAVIVVALLSFWSLISAFISVLHQAKTVINR